MVGLCEYFQNLNHPFLGSVTQDTHSYNQNRNIFNSITSLFTDKVWYRTCCESFKGTVSVISSDHAKKAIYNGTLRSFIWSKMWKIRLFFWFKRWYLWVSPLLLINKKYANHFREETTNENITFKETKTLISNSYGGKR